MAKEAKAAAVTEVVGSAARRRGAWEGGQEGGRQQEPGHQDDAREMEARGRMLTEYGELRRCLAALMAEASTLGAEFQELSSQLRMCPNVVSVEGLIAPNSGKPVFSESLFETSRLVALVSDIRRTIVRKNEIQERLQEIGILDAYGRFRY